MKFIGKLRSGQIILTDDYDDDEIRKEVPFKKIVQDLERFDKTEPCMVYDITGKYYRTVARTSYMPLDLIGI